MSTTRKCLIIGNWKCNGTISSTNALAKGVIEGLAKIDTKAVDVLVAPSMVHLLSVSALSNGSKLQVCSQNVSANPCGAFTGEVSADQLIDAGIEWTIIGHSERRQSHKIQSFETDKLIAQKVSISQLKGMNVCVCIGETEAERKEGKTFKVLENQIKSVLPSISSWERFSFAYEPLWAIGTGNTASAEQAQEVHDHVRKFLAKQKGEKIASQTRICYGGSVKPKNCKELIAQKDIDGFLVGGASLTPESFLPVIQSATK
ncbi:hypothetical protein AAMO2058_001105300 [Amorphochlora amoebiformis]|uniref:Triosephosphate isomerase n=1 Tax=Amorphochlora amoebiformis TaxID=1561963 RepID=A0A7S0DQ95_9EUKA|mmetsp:Transcript_5814/g.8923  ORF Transcript_5814/g.8923 Transcript_5814/m.8923 type:complete len:260 (+) Transcript_5814:77-856(+)